MSEQNSAALGTGARPGAWRERIPRGLRRFGVTAVGTVLLTLGVALLVLPGPGLLGILLGLTVLGTEYAWARRLADPLRRRLQRLLSPKRQASM